MQKRTEKNLTVEIIKFYKKKCNPIILLASAVLSYEYYQVKQKTLRSMQFKVNHMKKLI
jgi:hypothetical protein